MSYNAPDPLMANILGTPFAMSQGNMAIVDISAPGVGSVGGESSAPDGTWANPYRSIQAAVDATPTPDLGDFSTLTRTILIFPGIYDEDVYVTQPNIMAFLTIGQVILSGVVPFGPVAPADQRSFIYNVDETPVPAASLSIRPLDGYPWLYGGASRFWVTGGVVLAGDAGDPVNGRRSVTLQHVQAKALIYSGGVPISKLEGQVGLHLDRCNIDDGIQLPSDIERYQIVLERVYTPRVEVGAGVGPVASTNSSIHLIKCRISEHVICPEAHWDLCQDTSIGDSGQPYSVSEMWSYDQIENSYFGNGLTVHDTVFPRGAFTNTNIYGTITAPAMMVRLDPATNFYINSNGAVIGAGVRVLVHDLTIT